MPKRVPASKTPPRPASAWTKTLPTDPPRSTPAEAPSAPQKLSKPAAFAKSCEDAGWIVKRTIKGRDTDAPVRTVTATRNDEMVTARWAGERALAYGEFGDYLLTDATGGPLLSRKLSGAKQALEYVTTPPESVKRPVSAGQDGATVVKDMPWDPDDLTNAAVFAAVEGRELRWTSPGGVISHRVPPTTYETVEVTAADGTKTKVERQASNRHLKIEEYADGRRILTFVDGDTGLWRSVNLADLVNVS